MMLQIAIGGILISMVLNLIRACLGPSVFDRALAANGFATVTMLLIALDGFANERPEFLDLALIYGLLGFVGTLALLRFWKYGNLASDERPKS